MNKLLNLIFACLLFVSVAFSNEEKATQVIQITNDNSDIINTGNWLVEFYAPWCGHCKRLAPIYEELAELYNNNEDSKVKIAQVNCVDYQSVCSKNDIKGYPTIKYFTDGEVKDYRSGRDKKSFVTYLDNMSKSPILNIESTKQLKEKLEENKVSFIFVSSGSESTDKLILDEFKIVTKQIQDVDSPNFLVVSDSSLVTDEISELKSMIIKDEPLLVVYKDNEYQKYSTNKPIGQWVRINQFPLVSELTFSNQHMLSTSFKKIAMFVFTKKPTAENIQYMKSIASSVIQDPPEYGFTYIVENTFANWISNFKLAKSPSLLVFPEKMDIYYYEETVDPLNKSQALQFLSDVKDNKLSLKYLNRLGYYLDRLEEYMVEYLYYVIGIIIIVPVLIFFICMRDSSTTDDQKEKDQ